MGKKIKNKKNCKYFNSCKHPDCDTSFCIKKFKLDYYTNPKVCLIPENMQRRFPLFLDEDKGDKKAFDILSKIEKEDIVNFVNQAGGLYIYSHTSGNGKTSWAIRLGLSYMEKVWASKSLEPLVLYINIPKFLIALKSNIDEKNEYAQHILNNVATCDMVIWDDIGHKVGTEYEITQLLNLIDQRINNGKANIYTSNLSPKEFEASLGQRLNSRVCSYSNVIKFVGKDKRNIA